MTFPKQVPTPGRVPRFGVRPDLRLLLVALLAVAAIGLAGARIAPAILYAAGAGMLALFVVLAWRAPRVAIVTLVLTPVVDRYLLSLLLPRSLESVSTLFSELLLVAVGTTIAARAARDGTLLPAVRHPVVAILLAFTGVAALSAVANGVSPVVAVAGVAFTIDAAALFLLPRMAPFSVSQLEGAISVFLGLATAAALLALGQVVLHPDLFGLHTVGGAFGEGLRVASFLGNPNMLATVLAMAVPFAAIRTARAGLSQRGALGALVTLVLVLAMLYAFSRGTWLALAIGMLAVGLVVERRALLVVILAGGLAFGAAHVIPRELLLPASERHRFDFLDATLGRIDAIGEGRDLRFLFVANAAPIIADHPWIGAGPGRYGGAVAARVGSPLYEQYTAGRVPVGRTVDNFWLHALVEFGAVGVILLLAAIAGPVLTLIRVARNADERTRGVLAGAAAAGIILATVSLTEMVLEGNTTAFAMWFWLGAASMMPPGTPDPRPGVGSD